MTRFPHPADMPGDDSHPNSPNYVEPAFDISDAAANVAAQHGSGDMAELVADIAGAAGLVKWMAENVAIPNEHRDAWLNVLAHAENLSVEVERELEALNSPADPFDDLGEAA